MVRLMLVLAPVMCILSGIAVSSILSIYMKVGWGVNWNYQHAFLEC